jgi:mono/diheme cytochrome c family protein
MTRRTLNWVLLLLLVAAATASWNVDWNAAAPNAEFLPEMVRSTPYDAFDSNPNFADGKTLREPVAGTIPRGFLPLHYDSTAADLERAGQELHNPYALDDAAALTRGALQFGRMCTPCHGPGGSGDGVVALRGYPPPPSLLAVNAANLRDGQIFHIITFGKGNMPPHAAQVSREDRWKVILHIRSLQAKSQNPSRGTTQEAPSPPQ